MMDEGKARVSKKLANGYFKNTAYMDVIEKNELESALDVKNQDPKAKEVRRFIIATNITRGIFMLPCFAIWELFRGNTALSWILIAAYIVVAQLIIHFMFGKVVKAEHTKSSIVAMIIVDICVVVAFVVFVLFYFQT
ncbi:MAG: hypothetical protein E7189_03185 [Erysipelotrichaceae bacterium]|nr:hypothetical protein [Lachnospiraceae bacterium]MBE6119430.1 hypothetical protein [Erysipelotrichaceae bacterium]